MPWRGVTGLPWRLLGFTPPYDVFISYRRKHASELAQLIRRELEDRKLHVFLDVRELGAGPFDEQLLRRIARATDFVVVLTPGCLDECQRPGDWLAKEIGHAFDTGRNVVPVAVGGFECPPAQQLPPELVELPRQQWVRYEHEFSDESIERVYRMLRSRRGRSFGLGGRASRRGVGRRAAPAPLGGAGGGRPLPRRDRRRGPPAVRTHAGDTLHRHGGGVAVPERAALVLRRGRLQALPHRREPRSPRFAVLLPGPGHGDRVPVTRVEPSQSTRFAD